MQTTIVDNYYKAHMVIASTREEREEIEFFGGSGHVALVAYREIAFRAKMRGIPLGRVSVFRMVEGVPAGVPVVGAFPEVTP